MKPNKHVFSFPSSRGVQELEEVATLRRFCSDAPEQVAKLSPPEFPRSDKATSDVTHSGEKEEEEEYNSLTSTTRRLYPKKDDNVDLERGKSPAASENVSPKATNVSGVGGRRGGGRGGRRQEEGCRLIRFSLQEQTKMAGRSDKPHKAG